MGQPIELILSPFPIDDDGSSLDIAEVPQALHECLDPWRERRRRTQQKDADTRDAVGWLRPRYDRPRGRRAAEKRDERAPPHSITSSASGSDDCELVTRILAGGIKLDIGNPVALAPAQAGPFILALEG